MSSERYVVDASVLIAALHREPLADDVYDLLESATISVVNLCEVVSKLQERGAPDERIDAYLASLDFDIRPFDYAQAVRAGKMRMATRSAGLSLGDRACLALAIDEGSTVLTVDRALATLNLPVPVRIARP